MENDASPLSAPRGTGPAERQLTLTDGAGAQLFEIVELSGQEAVNRPFEFALRLRRLKTAGKAPADMLGRPMSIRWQIGPNLVRTVGGMLCQLTRDSQQDRFYHYSATFVPPIWPLTQNRSSRIFHDRTVPEILETLLHGYVAEFRWRRNDYVRRVQCIQYLESDLDFAARLMEDEGIHYYFDHARQSQMVVADDSRGSPTLVEPSRLEVCDVRGQTPTSGQIFHLEIDEQLTVPGVRALDYCFEQHSLQYSAAASCGPANESIPADRTSIESVGADAHFFDEYAANGERRLGAFLNLQNAVYQRALRSGERIAVDQLRMIASSDEWNVVPGYRFILANAGPEHDGSCFIVAVEHSYQLDDVKGWTLSNRFECVPIEVVFRPPLRTPKPKMGGLHSAIVTGPAGVPTWTDHYGRVQLRFHWQNDRSPDERTAWVRVVQAWAGPQYGALFTPRVGHEVLVEFEDGDPDRPMVVGSVYDEARKAPVPLHDEAAISGLWSRTNSVGAATAQSSHVVFVDTPNAEQLHLHAERHAHVSAEKAMELLVGWGAGPNGEKSYLSSSSKRPAAERFSLLDPVAQGKVEKVKGVRRNSVWGHDIDVTLGTAGDIHLGGWSQAHVGLGASLDIGLRTNLLIGLHVELNVAPQFSFSVGGYSDLSTGTRAIKTSKAMTQVVGGNYIEKISGSHVIVMGDEVPRITYPEQGTSFQYYDVAAFRAFASGPEALSPDSLAKENLLESQIEAINSRALDMINKSNPGLPPELLSVPDFDKVIADVAKGIKAIDDKYGTALIANLGDVNIASSPKSGKVQLVGQEINIIAKRVNYCVTNKLHLDGPMANNEFKAVGKAGVLDNIREKVHITESKLLETTVEAQITATQAASWLAAAAALPGVLVAGAALAGGTLAATKCDPAEWGL